MRGRQPRSPYLKALDGQYTGERPQSPGGIGPPPEDLTPVRKAIWEEVAAVAAPGLLTRMDRWMFKAYVVACDLWMQAVRMCDAKGLISHDVRHKRTARVAPWERIERSRARQVATLAGMLGLTPMSRSGLYIPPPAHKPSGIERYL